MNEQTSLADFDPELAAAMAAELVRQEDHVELIASENYASPRPDSHESLTAPEVDNELSKTSCLKHPSTSSPPPDPR